RRSERVEGLTLKAGLRDMTGRYRRVVVGEASAAEGWHLLEGPIAQEFEPAMEPPLSLVTLTWSEPPMRTTERSMAIDDISVVTARSEERRVGTAVSARLGRHA